MLCSSEFLWHISVDNQFDSYQMVKPRRMRWNGDVERIGQKPIQGLGKKT
jgi:hypothetical protein